MKNKLLFLVFLFCCLLPSVNAQRKVVQNQLLSDTKRLHFGFTLGMHFQDFGIDHSNAVDPTGSSYYMEVPSYRTGFTVGVISDLKIIESLNLRFVPYLDFGDRYVTFVDQNQQASPKTQIIKSTLLNFPLYLKYRSSRFNNYRPYLIVGGGVSINLSREKEDLLLLKSSDVFLEFGVGCDFYLPYFKLAPELKFCIGMMDILERDRPDLFVPADIKYTNALSKLTSRVLVLTFNFE